MLKLFFQVVVSGSRGYGYYRKPPPPSGKCVLMVHGDTLIYELTLLMWFT